jgi:hypothetical protein
MPQFRFGNMWTAYVVADLFLVSTNSTIRQDGALVMGRGIARQAKERFPGLDVAMGRQIQALCGNQGIYGLLVSSRWPVAKLGAFQVKRHYSQAASLELVRRSTAALCAWCADHPDAQVALNFPGVRRVTVTLITRESCHWLLVAKIPVRSTNLAKGET